MGSANIGGLLYRMVLAANDRCPPLEIAALYSSSEEAKMLSAKVHTWNPSTPRDRDDYSLDAAHVSPSPKDPPARSGYQSGRPPQLVQFAAPSRLTASQKRTAPASI